MRDMAHSADSRRYAMRRSDGAAERPRREAPYDEIVAAESIDRIRRPRRKVVIGRYGLIVGPSGASRASGDPLTVGRGRGASRNRRATRLEEESDEDDAWGNGRGRAALRRGAVGTDKLW